MIMSTDKPRRLGRGLEALFSARSTAEQLSRSRDDGPPSALRQIPITQIRTNHLQPRKEFNPSELADLEASIRANGLLQPVTVRTVSGGFELIAGERRLRAAQRIGWHEIPALVREIDDKEMLTLALVENLQRTDLNPIEEAEGYQHLVEQFSLTQQQVADVVGKDRSTIANTLRLLVLPSVVRRMVREGRISLGHARALLALGDDHRIVELANLIVKEGLNVRDVEQRVRPTRLPNLAGQRIDPCRIRKHVDRDAFGHRLFDRWTTIRSAVSSAISIATPRPATEIITPRAAGSAGSARASRAAGTSRARAAAWAAWAGWSARASEVGSSLATEVAPGSARASATATRAA